MALPLSLQARTARSGAHPGRSIHFYNDTVFAAVQANTTAAPWLAKHYR